MKGIESGWLRPLLLGSLVALSGCLDRGTEVTGLTRSSSSVEGAAEETSGGAHALASDLELLQDPGFLAGVAHGYANTLPDARDVECRGRWAQRSPTLAASRWLFWEIAEKTYFCDNSETPVVAGTRLEYASPDRSKLAVLPRDGSIRLVFDTSREWRKGCNLSLPDGSALPRYPDRDTNWPHFLIGQLLEDPREAGKRLALGRNRQLLLSASVRLNSSARPVAEECPAGTWSADAAGPQIPNHELFYMAIVLRHRSFPARVGQAINANQIYALVPMFYSENGTTPVNAAPWINADQYGNVVYFSPGHPFLSQGAWVDYAIDVEALAREALSQLKEKYGHDALPSDYHALGLLAGWEIWGGFRNDVEIRNFSLKERDTVAPVPSRSPSPAPLVPREAGEILGGIDGIDTSAGKSSVWGWTCAKGYSRPIGLHLYAGAPYPQGSILTLAAVTSLPGEEGVSRECGIAQGLPIRYRVDLSPALLQQHAGKPIYVYGIHPSGDGSRNRLLGGSGYWRIPAATVTPAPSPSPSPSPTPSASPSPTPSPVPSATPSRAPSPVPAPAGDVIGGIDGIESAGDKRYVWGWACAKGSSASIGLHLYAGGPYPQGSVLSVTQRTSLPGEEGVSRECMIPLGMPIRYRIELTAAQRQQHAGKPIYIYGIHPSGEGSLNRLLGGSGYWKMPAP